jgi:hypothetical protein
LGTDGSSGKAIVRCYGWVNGDKGINL